MRVIPAVKSSDRSSTLPSSRGRLGGRGDPEISTASWASGLLRGFAPRNDGERSRLTAIGMTPPILAARLAGPCMAFLLISFGSGAYAAQIAAKPPVRAVESHSRLILISLPAGCGIATTREGIALAVPGAPSPERGGTVIPAYELRAPRWGASFSRPAPLPPLLVKNPFLPKAP